MPTETIEAGADDVEENLDASTIDSTSNTIRIGVVGVDESAVSYGAGFRFQNVAIPTGATVTSAVLQMANAGGDSGVPVAECYIDEVDDAAAWSGSSLPSGITQYPIGGVSVDFDEFEGSVGTTFTADMTAAVQQVVDRAGWAENQSLRFFVDGLNSDQDNYVFVDASEKSGGTPAVLVVSYTHPGTSRQVLWDIEAAVTQTADCRWDVNQLATKATDLRWNIYVNIDSSLETALQWDVNTSVGVSAQMLWDAVQTQEISQGMAFIYGPSRPVLNPRDTEAGLKGKEMRVRIGDLVARVDSVEMIQLAAAKSKPGRLYAAGVETPDRRPAIQAKPDDDVILFTLALIDSEEI